MKGANNWWMWAVAAVVLVAVAIVAYKIGAGNAEAPESNSPAAKQNCPACDCEPAVVEEIPAREGKVYHIVIENSAFSPNELTISAGDNVTWTNNENTPHTVTSDSGGRGGLSSGVMGPGEQYTKQFLSPGEYPYHCNFHNTMKGKIVVE
jgi:plastocyanin